MSSRIITWLAWASLALSLVLVGLGALFFVLNGDTPVTPGWGPRGFQAALAATNAIVGAAILARYPRHLVGWLFSLQGLANAISYFAEEYSVYAVITTPGVLPLGAEVAWVRNWLWPVTALLIVLLPLLFPQGRLPSPRWRPVTRLAVSGTALACLAYALMPGPMDNFADAVNPFGIRGAGDTLLFVFIVGALVLLGCAAAAVVALVLRFRHAFGVERQQVKWLAYAAMLAVVTSPSSALKMPWNLLVIGAMLCVPIAVGIAILRHRLYDIDLIIRRTLIYAVLTALLAGVYFGGVVLLQALLRPLTGEGNDLAVVATTLLIAALFMPLRARVQGFIDRRFYRRKYNAAQTLAAFGEHVRDEVELDKLTGRLIEVVDETMQPTTISLWLRGTAR